VSNMQKKTAHSTFVEIKVFRAWNIGDVSCSSSSICRSMTSVWFRIIIFKSKARLQSECVVLAAHWSSFFEPPKNLNFRASNFF
jgi:hypothetical protein